MSPFCVGALIGFFLGSIAGAMIAAVSAIIREHWRDRSGASFVGI